MFLKADGKICIAGMLKGLVTIYLGSKSGQEGAEVIYIYILLSEMALYGSESLTAGKQIYVK